MTGKPIRIMLVDDDISFTIKGIIDSLEDVEDIEIMGIASDGEEIIETLAKQKLHPDLIVMDSRMEKLDGIPAARKIRKLYPDIKILILTAYHDDARHIQMARNAGVEGYITKIDGEFLETGIRELYKGNSYLSPKVLTTFFRGAGNNKTTNAKYRVSPEELKEKDIKFLQLLGEGFSKADIEKQMNIGKWGRIERMKGVKNKLGLDSTQALCAYAWRNSLCQ